MHIKEILTIALIVFAIVLILDKDGEIKNAIGDSITSKASVTDDIASSTTKIVNSNFNEALIKDAEKYQQDGDRQLALALKSVESKDWQECINKCISSRNNYDRSTDKFELAIKDFEDLRKEKQSHVVQAFIDTSIAYYTCSEEAGKSGIVACEELEKSCLENSQGSAPSGELSKDANQRLAELDKKRTSCDAILEAIN